MRAESQLATIIEASMGLNPTNTALCEDTRRLLDLAESMSRTSETWSGFQSAKRDDELISMLEDSTTILSQVLQSLKDAR